MDDNNKQTSVASDQLSDENIENVNEPVKEGEDIVTSDAASEESVVETSTEVKTEEIPVDEAEGAKTDTDSPMSEAGEVSSESTSIDVHEPNQAGDEQSESAELENQDQSSDQSTADETPAEEEVADKPTNDNPNAKWYVVHTYSGHENRVATTLRQRIESEHLEEKILDILVPTQDKIEIKSGKKVSIKEKIFPGYILVKMVLDDASWLAVRTTQGVTSFVGIGNKPTPISESEVQTIVRFTKEEAPTYKQVFQVNDTVKIVDGPFAEFIGKIDHVDEERGKVKVLVSIFGRETPVELDFLQVQKI